MQMAGLTLDSPFLAAPMAGVTRSPMRLMARRAGAGLVYTEMVSAEGLIRRQPRTWEMARVWPEERPAAVQLFGAQPARMLKAAALLREEPVDLVDVNMGCPARKVRRQGAGSALMEDPVRAAEVVAAVAEGFGGAVTVKLRLGFSRDELEDIVPGLVRAGAAAICLHGRTVKQGFAGRADWAAIARLKSWCPAPVIGNGDINSAAQAVELLARTGCDGVMIGRAAIGDPWIFARARARLWGQEPLAVTPRVRWEALAEQTDLALREGEGLALHLGRMLLIWYAKGLPGAIEVRRAAGQARDHREILRLGREFFAGLEAARA